MKDRQVDVERAAKHSTEAFLLYEAHQAVKRAAIAVGKCGEDALVETLKAEAARLEAKRKTVMRRKPPRPRHSEFAK